MKYFDVVVIGAGPIGSYVASELAEAGYGVVVLERKKKVGEQVCCTGIIGQECVSSFGIDSNVILRQVNSARLFSPSGGLLRLWRDKTQAYIIDRAAFDMAMANRAQLRGSEYRLNCLMDNIEVSDDKVKISATNQEERLELEAKAAVIATGFNPSLTEGLGLGKIADFMVGTQAVVETAVPSSNQVSSATP